MKLHVLTGISSSVDLEVNTDEKTAKSVVNDWYTNHLYERIDIVSYFEQRGIEVVEIK